LVTCHVQPKFQMDTSTLPGARAFVMQNNSCDCLRSKKENFTVRNGISCKWQRKPHVLLLFVVVRMRNNTEAQQHLDPSQENNNDKGDDCNGDGNNEGDGDDEGDGDC